MPQFSKQILQDTISKHVVKFTFSQDTSVASAIPALGLTGNVFFSDFGYALTGATFAQTAISRVYWTIAPTTSTINGLALYWNTPTLTGASGNAPFFMAQTGMFDFKEHGILLTNSVTGGSANTNQISITNPVQIPGGENYVASVILEVAKIKGFGT